jgi:nucleotide-binding universal stress UspA family protein
MAAKRAQPRPARSPVVEYRRILVPLVGSEASEQAVTIACGLAAEHGCSVTALTVIEVPPELPLDAHMLEEEIEAKHLLADAKAIGDLYGVNVAARIVRARAAGAAIVEETETEGKEIIVLRAPRKQRLGRRAAIFGKTVDYVLKHAPCRVMVAAPPPEA